MSNIDTTVWADDVNGLIADLSIKMTIGGNAECDALVGDDSKSLDLEMAGLRENVMLEAIVPVLSLTIAPVNGMIIICNARQYRITNVSKDPYGIQYNITAESLLK